LFEAVVQWCKEQKDELSSSDIKSVFAQIRYPLKTKDDLIEKVHPTNMADPDPYKAALEYRDTDKFDGSQEQITLRQFYFDFDDDDGLTIEHTSKGTLITKSHLPTEKSTCAAPVDSTEFFIFRLISCSDKTKIFITLLNNNTSTCFSENVEKIPIGKEIYGQISIEFDDDNKRLYFAEFGEVVLRVPVENDTDMCYILFTLCSEGDQISILRD